MNELLNIGFAITGFTILILLLKRKDERQSKYAMLLLLLWSTRFLALFLKAKVDLHQFPFLIVFDQSLYFLDGLFLFWYIDSFKNKQKISKKIIQLIPFLLAFCFSLLNFFAVERSVLIEYYYSIDTKIRAGNYDAGLQEVIFISLMLLINAFYFFKSFGLLRQYKAFLTDNFSNLFSLKVNWLQQLIYFWVLFIYIPFSLYFYNYLFGVFDYEIIHMILSLGMVVAAILFSMKVIHQQYPIAEQAITHLEKKGINEDDRIEAEQTFAILTQYIKESESFKNESLTLKSLSEKLALRPSKISVAINTQNKTNFHEFINSYRIESVKKELTSTNEQIIIIAYRNGFNSKSTFNSVFKKMTGMTPSEYRKKS